ncbi:MAG TPA: hypothetical protein VF601_18570 [Beijerinckiaceae bacterium]
MKAEGGYTAGSVSFDVALDAVYDRPGAQGYAWGTMRYGRSAERIYAHARCVGIFDQGKQASVAGPTVKYLGGASPWIVFEFDLQNQRIRVFGAASENEALAYCDKPSGSYPGAFDFGYIAVR